MVNRWCSTKYMNTCSPPPHHHHQTSYRFTSDTIFSWSNSASYSQQHCVQSREVYNLQLPPCACCESYRGLLHIMWFVFDSLLACGTQPNHIIPLLPTSQVGTRSLHSLVLLIESQIKFQMLLEPLKLQKWSKQMRCLMDRLGGVALL